MSEVVLENRFRTPFIFVVKDPAHSSVRHSGVQHRFHSLLDRVHFAMGSAHSFCSSFSFFDLERVKERFPNMGKYATSISEAIEKGLIEIYTKPNAYNPTETMRLRGEIQRVLNEIINQEKAEAAQIAAQHAQRNRLENAAAWGGAIAEGFGESAVSFLIWAKDVAEVVSLQARIQRVVEAQLSAYWEVGAPWDDPEAWVKRFQTRLKEAEYKELIDVLGFDPRQVEIEKVAKAYEIALLLYNDQDMQATLKRFAMDYASAQHGLEIAHMAGSALFEVVLTAVLVFLTAGLGVAAQASHKLRLSIDALKRLGKLFVELTEQLKRNKMLRRRQPKPLGNDDSKPSGRSTFDDGSVGGQAKPGGVKPSTSAEGKTKQQSKPKSKEDANTNTEHTQKSVPKKVTSPADLDPDYVEQRISELSKRFGSGHLVGHSPQRHGGHVDNPKLHDRSIPQPGTQYGIDPASGTITDAYTGRPHRAQRTSTSFSSDEALVFAEEHIRNSQRLADEIASSVDGTATVDIPLKDIYGARYKENVRGLTRIGSARNPQGVEFTDFTDGTVKATYIFENNKWNLITMFPQPKRL